MFGRWFEYLNAALRPFALAAKGNEVGLSEMAAGDIKGTIPTTAAVQVTVFSSKYIYID